MPKVNGKTFPYSKAGKQKAQEESKKTGKPMKMSAIESAMSPILVTCNRCGNDVDGSEDAYATAGFYNLTGYWAEYKRTTDEARICDACMFSDPKYQAAYGIHHVDTKVIHIYGE